MPKPNESPKAKKNEITIRSSAAEYLTFITTSGEGGVEAIYADENVWLTQKMMGVLYNVETHTINYHLKKVFSDNELSEDSVIRDFRITADDGKSYNTKHYNLKAIIAVGYKVNSERAVQFRKWATAIVEEFTVKAYVMDDERLKNGHLLTDKYFEEQLQRIREIRLSERKFYQKITDIYATSTDYDTTATATKRFFATVQNKLHWAIHGHTAAELIVPTYTFGRSKTLSRAQRRAQERGESWKERLQQAISFAMTKSHNKKDFIFNMERQGYFVKWTDARKTITYTCPNGKGCRDDRLFGDKYSKLNMELEFLYRSGIAEKEEVTGWEHERELLPSHTHKQAQHEIYTPRTTNRKLTNEVLHNLRFLEKGVSEDDELETITHLATLTALSFAGVYILLDALSRSNQDEIDNEILENYINELKQEPENCIDYEEEQVEEQGFTMTMM